MPVEQREEQRGTCFVVMGFGQKTDFETGRTLDLDKTYKNIIKPAVEGAGLRCVRADEIVHSGIIDVPMYDQLLQADVVIADLSTSNLQVYYQLGVRHALRPHTTIIISEDGVKSYPFDVNHVLIRQYHHFGTGIDFEEVERFRKVLGDAITSVLREDPRPVDSPVYNFLNGLTPPATTGVTPDAPGEASREEAASDTYGMLMEEAEKARRAGDYATAKMLLMRLRESVKASRPEGEDANVVRRLALVTYAGADPTRRRAVEEAIALLALLGPATSNDAETLGLWGVMHQHLWQETGAATHLDEAVRAYDRVFYLREAYHDGVTLAYLLNVRADAAARMAGASPTSGESVALRAAAVADFVQAERFRREVLTICESLLEREKLSAPERYSVLAAMAESYVGVGDEEHAQRILERLGADAHDDNRREEILRQVGRLRGLLADSPLKYVKADAA